MDNHPLPHTNDFLDRYMNNDDGKNDDCNNDEYFDNKRVEDNATMDNHPLCCINDFLDRYMNN